MGNQLMYSMNPQASQTIQKAKQPISTSQLKSGHQKNILKQYQELYLCPISLEVMDDPASLPCGHTFEKVNIERVIKDTSQCPLDRQRFKLQNIVPNFFAKQSIQLFQKQLQEKKKQQQASKNLKNQHSSGSLKPKEKYLKVYQNKTTKFCQKCSNLLDQSQECKKCPSVGECISCGMESELEKQTMTCKECIKQQQSFLTDHEKNQCQTCKCQLDSVYHKSKCMKVQDQVFPLDIKEISSENQENESVQTLFEIVGEIKNDESKTNNQKVKESVQVSEYCRMCNDRFLLLQEGYCPGCYRQKMKRNQRLRN